MNKITILYSVNAVDKCPYILYGWLGTWRLAMVKLQNKLNFRKYSQIMMTSSNGNIFHVTGHFVWGIHRWPVTRSFDVFFDLRRNERLSKQSWGWWFETPSRPSWRHSNVPVIWDTMLLVWPQANVEANILIAIPLFYWRDYHNSVRQFSINKAMAIRT